MSEPARPRVLVADDEPDILALIGTALRRAGCEVIAATDGDEALRLARAERPDAVVLDVAMPRLGGHEVTRAIRADALVGGIPILIVSASASAEDRARGLLTGADGFMAKPFSPHALAQRVLELLGGR